MVTGAELFEPDAVIRNNGREQNDRRHGDMLGNGRVLYCPIDPGWLMGDTVLRGFDHRPTTFAGPAPTSSTAATII